MDGETSKKYTFRELSAAVTAFASAITRQGIRKGDIVAFYAPNSVEYCIGIFGCLSVGAVISGVNPSYTTCTYVTLLT